MKSTDYLPNNSRKHAFNSTSIRASLLSDVQSDHQRTNNYLDKSLCTPVPETTVFEINFMRINLPLKSAVVRAFFTPKLVPDSKSHILNLIETEKEESHEE